MVPDIGRFCHSLHIFPFCTQPASQYHTKFLFILMTRRFKSLLRSFIGFETEFIISARYMILSSSSAVHATFPSEFPGHTKALSRENKKNMWSISTKTVDKTFKWFFNPGMEICDFAYISAEIYQNIPIHTFHGSFGVNWTLEVVKHQQSVFLFTQIMIMGQTSN